MSDALSGFLLWSEPLAIESVVSISTRLHGAKQIAPNWRRFDYVTQEPIKRVDTIVAAAPYTHPLFIRRGADRFIIILSDHYLVCDHFIGTELRPSVAAILRKTNIRVHELIESVTDARTKLDSVKPNIGLPAEAVSNMTLPPPIGSSVSFEEWEEFNQFHTLGYGAATTDAFRGELQKLEFSGDDLARVSLFTETIRFVSFRTCALRRHVLQSSGITTSYELLKMGKSGFVSTQIPFSQRAMGSRLEEIELMLNFLHRAGFVK